MVTIDMGRKEGGAAVPLSRGEVGSPSNTVWPGPRSTSVPGGVFIHPAKTMMMPLVMGQKLVAVPLLRGSCDPI